MSPNLGKLISVHSTSPASLQRAAIVAMLSFVFFLSILLVFYIRQQIGYFVLSSAFLVVYIFTMIGWWMQKRNVVKFYENGLTYKKSATTWKNVAATMREKSSLNLITASGETINIPTSIDGIETIEAAINLRINS